MTDPHREAAAGAGGGASPLADALSNALGDALRGLDRQQVEAATAAAREAVRFVPDVVTMLRDVAADPRVPPAAKLEAAAAIAYLASPLNRITSVLPLVGSVDDVAVVAFAVRRLLLAAGEPVLREHWRGTPRGLEIVLTLTAALSTPRGAMRRTALLGAAVKALGGASRRLGRGRVVEGEVLSRREETG